MANIKTTYQAFREWLIWVRKNKPDTAKCTVSYLRNLEERLFADKIEDGKLSSFHKKLIDIDEGRNVGFNLDSMVRDFSMLKKVIDEVKDDCRQAIGYETINNWSRAFNSYLAFLCDVTGCFTLEQAKRINPRFGAGAKNETDLENPQYVKRLELFLCGVHKSVLRVIGIQGLTDQLLDAFHETMNLAIQNVGVKNNIPTEFLINSSVRPSMVDWRSIILDNIRCENLQYSQYSYYYGIMDYRMLESLSYNIICHGGYIDIDRVCTDIFESVMRAYRCMASTLGVDRNNPIQIDALKRKILDYNSADLIIPNSNDFITHIWRIHDIIKDYSQLFEVKFESQYI